MNATTTASTTSTTATTATSARWTLDPGHSAVGFSVRHLMITNVRGEFARFRGDVVYDAAQPDATRIDATIDTASLDTREAKRDTDLRGPLFFDVEAHPEIRFVSRSARATARGELDLTGDLTIRGTTREVTLSVRDISAPQVDMRGNTRVGASATTTIRRSEFGMTWNKALEAGGVVVGDVVTITLELSLVKSA
jgi:polyisoprenoid-binding protein YceI